MSEPATCCSFDVLDPRFRPKAERVVAALRARLAPLRLFPVVSETKRSVERQLWLYESDRKRGGRWRTDKDGTTKKSNHQSGLAIDILIYRVSRVSMGPLLDDAIEWKFIGEEGKKEGLRWGGDWEKQDKPHLELVLP